MMPTWLMLFQIIISILLIGAVLFKNRKESAGGGVFRGGAFADHKGKKGKEVLLLRLTTGIAVLFMISSVMISILK